MYLRLKKAWEVCNFYLEMLNEMIFRKGKSSLSTHTKLSMNYNQHFKKKYVHPTHHVHDRSTYQTKKEYLPFWYVHGDLK